MDNIYREIAAFHEQRPEPGSREMMDRVALILRYFDEIACLETGSAEARRHQIWTLNMLNGIKRDFARCDYARIGRSPLLYRPGC